MIIHVNVDSEDRQKLTHFIDQHTQCPVVHPLLCPFASTISGAKYSRVPHRVYDLPSMTRSQSQQFDVALIVDQQFSGLRSQQIFSMQYADHQEHMPSRTESSTSSPLASWASVVVQEGEELSSKTQLHEHIHESGPGTCTLV